MGPFAKQLASAAWILARAVGWSDATAATVCFGEQVTAVTRPGHVPAHVRHFHANDATEVFCQAVDASTARWGCRGAGEGARLLVVVSDGYYTPASAAAGKHGCSAYWPPAAGCCGLPCAKTPSPWTARRWSCWTTLPWPVR
jgi:hypothetical protein